MKWFSSRKRNEPNPQSSSSSVDNARSGGRQRARPTPAATSPLSHLAGRLGLVFTLPRSRRNTPRGRLQSEFSRYSRAYFQRWLMIGAIIGVLSGLLMAAFYFAIDLATRFFLGLIAGYTPPQPAGEGVTAIIPIARPWLLPVATTLGGLLVGLIVYKLAPETARGGTDHVLKAFHEQGGRIRKRVAPVKLIASAITIGSGGSAGREGAAAQIMGGIGSWLGQSLRLDEHDRQIAVVAGMGAGIGTVFRAPFAGALFGAEVLYKRDFEADAIFPTFIASVVGYTVYGGITGWSPIFGAHNDFGFKNPSSLTGFLILGILAGVIGLLFEWAMRRSAKAFDRLPMPIILKPALGGLIVGLIGIAAPAALGMGYGYVQFGVNNDYTSLTGLMLAGLVFAKIATTSLTLGSGGSGGDVAPAMVAGGFLGGALWAGLHYLYPPMVAGVEPAAFVLVGMAAFFGGISKTPLAMILMVTEMSGELSLIAPAMLATMVAYLITGERSVYHAQVATRLDSQAHRDDYAISLMQRATVEQVLAESRLRPLPLISLDTTLADASTTIRESSQPAALVREDGRIAGIITMTDIRRAPADDLSAMLVNQVMSRDIVTAHPDELMYTAWMRMTRRDLRQVVVVTRGKPARQLGVLTIDDIRRALHIPRPMALGTAATEPEAPSAARATAGSTARATAGPAASASRQGGSAPASESRVADAMLSNPIVVSEAATVDEIRPLVLANDCVLLTDNAGLLSGLIVLKDLRDRSGSAVAAQGKPLVAKDIATRNVITARSRERVTAAARRMLRAGVRQLPIVEGEAPGTPIGLLRRSDALAAYDAIYGQTDIPDLESSGTFTNENVVKKVAREN